MVRLGTYLVHLTYRGHKTFYLVVTFIQDRAGKAVRKGARTADGCGQGGVLRVSAQVAFSASGLATADLFHGRGCTL